MRIGALAEASGVSARSLRYYEQNGLIRSERTPGGWRDFDESMVERVVVIQHLFAAGLSSATINELLPCLEAPPAERTGLLEQLLAQECERLEAKRRDIDRELDTLRALRKELPCLPHQVDDGKRRESAQQRESARLALSGQPGVHASQRCATPLGQGSQVDRITVGHAPGAEGG